MSLYNEGVGQLAMPIGSRISLDSAPGMENSQLAEIPPEKPPGTANADGQPDLLTYCFMGPNGLRAGWSVALFVAFAFIFFKVGAAVVGYVLYAWLHPGHVLEMVMGEPLFFLAVLGATAVMGRIEGRPVTAYGLADGKLARRFSAGIATGFAALSVLLALLAGLQDYAPGNLAVHGARIAGYAILWAFLFLSVGLCEEVYFRGYALTTLARGIGYWPAAFVLSILFGLAHRHNPGEDWFGLLSVMLFGLMLCFAIRRTGSLWWGIGFHAMWDYSQSFLYSTPDSGMVLPGHLLNAHFRGPAWLTGGSVGPEGSWLIVPMLAGVAVVVHFLYPRQRESALDPQSSDPEAGGI